MLTTNNDLHADCQDGEAVVVAASSGNMSILQMLLGWNQNTPKANCQDGKALAEAIISGCSDVVSLLLTYPQNPAKADCFGGGCLLVAFSKKYDYTGINEKYDDIINLLREHWPNNGLTDDIVDMLLTLAAWRRRVEEANQLIELFVS
jgi:hypothetical protein